MLNFFKESAVWASFMFSGLIGAILLGSRSLIQLGVFLPAILDAVVIALMGGPLAALCFRGLKIWHSSRLRHRNSN
jgi:hypothetical protein